MRKKLQVFVSSTFQDLIPERQSAVSAILKLGHIPAGMELFTANDKSQWETIKQWIDESDVYMLILGGRYGSIEEISGLSYTELEYNYALDTKKPLFAVVINDEALNVKVKEYGLACNENENPKLLKEFRSKVLSYMSSFYDDVKDIKICVMESLPVIAQRESLSGWVSASEIPDTKSLIDEISSLIVENERLKKENARLEKTKSKSNLEEEDFKGLALLLSKISVNRPPSENNKDGSKISLYQLFSIVWETLVKGVTNQTGQSETIYFIYNSVCPKLQVHDLVMNEKVASVRWRRFTLTSKGQRFAAYLERQSAGKND
ncbi:DUF4062 domain-containing protein [Rahnella perminowiae]|uniref:DUF4062 domain-containing protein n=1 Tax=Rahnella perminowiae TaxID=2816244 RepID=UPI00224B8720|nr:DUF4062 domain-containing protein [Rahnella perminowiae]MCX2946035.1 DUF4062 domain-containing protein [Rahnella perminowiae]